MPKIKSQLKKKSDSFEEVAKRLGATDDEAAFEAKLKKIAKAKPKDESLAQSKRRR